MSDETVKNEEVVNVPVSNVNPKEVLSSVAPVVSDPTPIPQEESSTSKAEATVNTSESQEPEKKKSSMIDDLKKERAKRRELQSELQALKEQVSSLTNKSQQPTIVKEIAQELGIDEDSATKFLNVHNKLNSMSQSHQDQRNIETQMVKGFQAQVDEVRDEYQDWDKFQDKMQNEFVKEYSKNPAIAYQRGPEFYYLRAKASQVQSVESARQQGQVDMATKITNKNLAAVESSRTAPVKPVSSKWTRDKIRQLTPEQYSKHRVEIDIAARRGEIN